MRGVGITWLLKEPPRALPRGTGGSGLRVAVGWQKCLLTPEPIKESACLACCWFPRSQTIPALFFLCSSSPLSKRSLFPEPKKKTEPPPPGLQAPASPWPVQGSWYPVLLSDVDSQKLRMIIVVFSSTCAVVIKWGGKIPICAFTWQTLTPCVALRESEMII